MRPSLFQAIRCRFNRFLQNWVTRCQTRRRQRTARLDRPAEALECRQLLSAVAIDGFESGDFDGGSEQWNADGGWVSSGDASVRTDGPNTGSYHARLRRSSGDLQRIVDISNLTDVQLHFAARMRSFEGSDQAHVRVSGDGQNWITLQTFANGDDDNQYHDYALNVPDVGDTLYVRFDAAMSGSRDYWYLDDISVSGEPAVVAPGLSIDDVEMIEGDNGTAAMIFTVTRSGDSSGTSSVDFTTVDGTAEASTDYVATSGTLQFLAGEPSRSVSVTINGDYEIEQEEFFTVQLSNPTGATIDNAEGRGIIRNDDGDVFPNDPAFAEQWQLHNTGQTGGSFDADIDMPAAWSVTTGSTSTVVAVLGTGVEYTHPDLYLNTWLNQDEIPASLFAALTDSDGDGLITFRDLNDASNSGLVTDLNGTGFIDGGDLLADATWADGLDTDGNGFTDDLVGWDFIDNDNDPLPGGGTGGHETGIAKNIGAIGNNGFEGAGVNWQIQMMPVRTGLSPVVETFDAPIAGLNYAVAEDVPISANAWGNYELFDQSMYDAIDAARLNDHLFIAAAGNVGTDNDGPQKAYPASYDLDNIISVAGVDDNDELTTNFGLASVDLAGPGPGSSRGSSLTAGVAALIHSLHPDWTYSQIKDRILSTVDPLPSHTGKTVTGGRLNAAAAVAGSSIHISDPSIVEGDTGGTNLVFTVTRRGDVAQGLTIDWATADGTALAGSDYVAAANTLVFLPGEINKTISVTVNADLLDEGDETLFVNLTNPSGGLLADAAGQGTVINDDTQISIDDVSVIEGDNSAHYRGVFVDGLPGGHFNPITFGPDGHVYTAVGTGEGYNTIRRYNGATGEFIDTFMNNAGGHINGVRDIVFHESDGLVYVASAYTDEVLRYDATTGEFVDVFVTANSGGIDHPDGMAFGPDANGDGIDDLYVTGWLSHSVVRYDGVTGASLGTYIAPGSGGLSNPFAFDFGPDGVYVTSAGTNEVLKYDTASGAYLGVAASEGLSYPRGLTFGPDGLLYVSSGNNDRILRYQTDGTFLGDYVQPGSGGLDNPRSLAFNNGDLYVTATGNTEILRYGEGMEAVFTLSLSNPSSLPITVDFSTSDGTATAGDDYTPVNGTVTFPAGITSRTVLVPIIDDGEPEPTENFALNLSNAVVATIVDAQGLGEIVDNEVPNAPPNVDAGADQTLNDADGTGSESVTLTGTAWDSDGTIVGYEWSDGTTVLGTSQELTTSLPVGQHTLIFSASDDDGETSSDSVVVTVLANQGPSADAGDDITLTDNDENGSESVALNGIGNDADGAIVGYEWTNGSTLLGNTPSISPNLPVGTHELTLTVTDNGGATASDTITVTIEEPADATPIYVYDIRFESAWGGWLRRAVFEIRSDSNGDGQGGASDNVAAGVEITVVFAGQTYTGTTDANGVFRTGWLWSPPGGSYAEVVDLVLADHSWDPLLMDLEDDSDGDGLPDGVL